VDREGPSGDLPHPRAHCRSHRPTGRQDRSEGNWQSSHFWRWKNWFNPGEQRYHFYVLEDKTGNYSPKEWATVAKQQFEFWLADRIVAERNNGGDMVESNIHTVDENLPVTVVWASKGKHIRAEPVSALSEQGRIHHVGPGRNFVDLEDQCCEWEPGMESPNNLDAFVWAITDLMDAGTTDDDTNAHTDFWNRDDDFEQDLARSLGLED
jgi:hypothetical protein